MDTTGMISLDKYLERKGNFTFPDAYRSIRPLVLSIAKDEGRASIHGEIDPANMMVQPDGSLILTDSGFTCDYEDDVYAVCAVIYKMITGITAANALQRSRGEKLDPPSQKGALISFYEEQVLLMGMEIEKEKRIKSLEELDIMISNPPVDHFDNSIFDNGSQGEEAADKSKTDNKRFRRILTKYAGNNNAVNLMKHKGGIGGLIVLALTVIILITVVKYALDVKENKSAENAVSEELEIPGLKEITAHDIYLAFVGKAEGRLEKCYCAFYTIDGGEYCVCAYIHEDDNLISRKCIWGRCTSGTEDTENSYSFTVENNEEKNFINVNNNGGETIISINNIEYSCISNEMDEISEKEFHNIVDLMY
ncbi:MAG: hypothetical protein IKR23_09545 [Lachnospiraceae bacterium]|nr:hypothetical protein [Lachnospiraceae bacterium]